MWFSKIFKDTKLKKETFIKIILPLVVAENQKILNTVEQKLIEIEKWNIHNRQYKQYQDSIQSYGKKIKAPKIIQKVKKKAPTVYQ